MQSYQQCMVSQGKVAVVPHCTSVLGRLVQLQSRWCNYSVTAIYWAGEPQGNQQGAPLQFSPSVLLIVIIIIGIIGTYQHHHWHSSASSVSSCHPHHWHSSASSLISRVIIVVIIIIINKRGKERRIGTS